MTITPSEQLLLFHLSEQKYQSEDQLQYNDNSWKDLIHLSLKHNVLPILYRKSKRQMDQSSVKENFLKTARSYYLQAAEHNILLYHRLEKIIGLICEADIPVILLKGAYLNEVVYQNIALRSMADVDLLFRKQDLPKAQQALQDAGWLSNTNGVLLDIHCELTQDLPINIEEIWQRAEPATVANHQVLVLSPEDMLIATCIHLSYHHLFESAGLRSLVDIAEIIKFYRDRMNWEIVYERSLEWGVGNSVYLSLLLVRDLLGADIPNSLMIQLAPDDFSAQQKEWALNQIFADKPKTTRNLSQYFWKLFSEKSFFAKLKLLRQLTMPSPEMMSQKYLTVSGSFTNYARYMTRLKQHFLPYMRACFEIATQKPTMKSRLLYENRKIKMKEWLSAGRRQ